MAPREATLKAMEEVSGPVVSIALILASVFIPVAFMGGIQGSLNKQFALTIAISVLISAFNALTLSPALAAMWLRPRKHSAVCSAASSTASTARSQRRRTATSRVSRALIRKAVVGVAILAGFAVLAGGLGRRLPTSFVPEEDYGYFLLNVQLPPAASLQRTDDVCRKVEAILTKTEGLQALQRHRRLQPADARHGAEQRLLLRRPQAVGRAAQRTRRAIDRRSPERAVPRRDPRSDRAWPSCRRRSPASDPRAASASGCRIDRAASIEYLDQALQKFLAEARKRPELAGVTSPFSAAVAADVRRRRSRQGAQGRHRARRRLPDDADVPGRLLRQPVQPLRPAVARVPAGRGPGAHRAPTSIGQFYVRNNDGNMVPMSSLQTSAADVRPAVHEPLQRLSRGAGHRRGRARLQLGPGARRARGGGEGDAAADISYDWADLSYQERKAVGQRVAALRAVARLRVPDPGGALRELVAAVLGAAVGAGRGGRRVRRPADAAVRLRRLRADRRRHADRPGGEERDPDRRVRQGAQRRRQGPGRPRRSRARSSGCGRS